MENATAQTLQPFYIALIAMVFLMFAETALAAAWNRLYFTVGLPLFIRRIPVKAFRLAPLDTSKLEEEFKSTFTDRALVFKEVDDHQYAFREKLFEFTWFRPRNSQIMHGILIFDHTRQQVIVRGFANLWALAGLVVLALLSMTMQNLSWVVLIIGLVVIGVAYYLQARRFERVAQRAAELASVTG